MRIGFRTISKITAEYVIHSFECFYFSVSWGALHPITGVCELKSLPFHYNETKIRKFNCLQFSVSIIRTGNLRQVNRGGGQDGAEWYVTWKGLINCTSYCNAAMQPEGLCTASPCDPFYAHCYDALGIQALNGKRAAFPSQLGTTDLDPALPQITPVTNFSACMRMFTKFVNYSSLRFKLITGLLPALIMNNSII